MAVLEVLVELSDILLVDWLASLELVDLADELFLLVLERFCVLVWVVDSLLDADELVDLELPHPANKPQLSKTIVPLRIFLFIITPPIVRAY